jgi:hypothetical protein
LQVVVSRLKSREIKQSPCICQAKMPAAEQRSSVRRVNALRGLSGRRTESIQGAGGVPKARGMQCNSIHRLQQSRLPPRSFLPQPACMVLVVPPIMSIRQVFPRAPPMPRCKLPSDWTTHVVTSAAACNSSPECGRNSVEQEIRVSAVAVCMRIVKSHLFGCAVVAGRTTDFPKSRICLCCRRERSAEHRE